MPRDFSAITGDLGRAAADLAPAAQQHVRTIGDQLDVIARGDTGSVFQDAHDDVTLEIFAPPEFPLSEQRRDLTHCNAPEA